MKRKALIIGESKELYRQIHGWVEARNFYVLEAASLEKAASLVRKQSPSILFVTERPCKNSIALTAEHETCGRTLRFLRKSIDAPIVVITHNNSESSRISNYRNGADDVIGATLSVTELELKLSALLRRIPSEEAFEGPAQRVLEGITFDKINNSIEIDRAVVKLTPVQFRLLWMLASSPKKFFSRETLFREVMEKPLTPYDRSLDMQISRIRGKLAQLGLPGKCINSIRGRGYRFVYESPCLQRAVDFGGRSNTV